MVTYNQRSRYYKEIKLALAALLITSPLHAEMQAKAPQQLNVHEAVGSTAPEEQSTNEASLSSTQTKECLSKAADIASRTLARFELGEDGALLTTPAAIASTVDTVFLVDDGDGKTSIWAERNCRWLELASISSSGKVKRPRSGEAILKGLDRFSVADFLTLKDSKLQILGMQLTNSTHHIDRKFSRLLFKTHSGAFFVLPQTAEVYEGLYILEKQENSSLVLSQLNNKKASDQILTVTSGGIVRTNVNKAEGEEASTDRWFITDINQKPELPPPYVRIAPPYNEIKMKVFEDGTISTTESIVE